MELLYSAQKYDVPLINSFSHVAQGILMLVTPMLRSFRGLLFMKDLRIGKFTLKLVDMYALCEVT